MSAVPVAPSNLSAALTLAEVHGLPVFPCRRADEWVEIAQMEECLAFMRRLKSELSR